MTGRFLLRSIPIILIIFLLLSMMPGSLAKGESNQVTLYYGDSGELSTTEPANAQDQTVSTTIGSWSTTPLAKPLTISGTVTSTIWASGIGTAYFEFRLLLDNDPIGIILTSDSKRLSQTPQEFTGTQPGLDFAVAPDAVFGIEVQIYFRGVQCNVYWGSTEHPSEVRVSCDSVSISNPSYKFDPGSQKVTINTTIVSAFGMVDIVRYDLQISGPTTPENLYAKTTGLEDERCYAAWVWEYGKDKIQTGEEYQVTVEVEDNSGNLWSKSAEESIVIEPDQEAAVSSDVIQLIVILVIVLIVGFLVAYKLFIGKIIHENISLLGQNTEYFSDYKLLIVSEVLHSFAWYLLLVISLFIFSAAWSGWGAFLVGLNEGMYQTISVLLFLSLAKGSDTRGKRKNLLLSLLIIGAILLFIMAWVSLVPSPGITIVIIIILFTLFVLCYYGTDNLELALVTEYFPEKVRGKAYGILRAIGNIGGLIGGVLSGYFFDVIGFWFCFMLAGFIMLASFFVLFPIRDVGFEKKELTLSNWFQNFISEIKQSNKKLRSWASKVSQAAKLVKIEDYLFKFKNQKQMTLLFYTTLFTLIAYGMIVPFIFVFLSEVRGESATVLSLVYTIFGIAIFLPLNQFAAGWLCDKYGARKVYAGAIFAYIGLWGIFNLTIPITSSNVIVMAVFIFPIWPFLWIGYKMFVANITPRTERVRGLTSIRLALGIGIVIGSVGGGVLLSYLPYETVFQSAMVFTFIAAVLAGVLLKMSGEDETIEIV